VGVPLLTERHQGQIAGVLSCHDRIIIQGTVPKWCYAKGMTDCFYERQIRIFDYPKWAEPPRDAIRENMERMAADNGLEIEFVRSKKSFRKEQRVKEVLEKRGQTPRAGFSGRDGVGASFQSFDRAARPPAAANVSFFKHYRKVEHKDGTRNMAWAEMKKSISSLAPLRELLLASNRRHLEFISAIEDDKAGTGKLNQVSQSVQENDRNYRGFNFFDARDEQLFESLGRGEFNISGFQNKDLRRRLSDRTSGQISRTIKRLRVHGLIKKVGRTYKYYLSALGKQVITLGLKLKELDIIPALSTAPVC
jgi:hypothetical protein